MAQLVVQNLDSLLINSYSDVAKYTAEAVTDESLANVTLEFAGEVTTFKQMLAAYEEVK